MEIHCLSSGRRNWSVDVQASISGWPGNENAVIRAIDVMKPPVGWPLGLNSRWALTECTQSPSTRGIILSRGRKFPAEAHADMARAKVATTARGR